MLKLTCDLVLTCHYKKLVIFDQFIYNNIKTNKAKYKCLNEVSSAVIDMLLPF